MHFTNVICILRYTPIPFIQIVNTLKLETKKVIKHKKLQAFNRKNQSRFMLSCNVLFLYLLIYKQ